MKMKKQRTDPLPVLGSQIELPCRTPGRAYPERIC
jgi:hypothetical protein